MSTAGYFTGVKLQWSETKTFPLINSEIRNGGDIRPLSHMSSRTGSHYLELRDKFTFPVMKLKGY
jgi:hypothetical protein